MQGPGAVTFLYCTRRSRAPGFLTTLGAQGLPAQPLLTTTPSESTGCLLGLRGQLPENCEALQLPPPSSSPSAPAPPRPLVWLKPPSRCHKFRSHRSPAQVGCMRQVLRAGAPGRPRGVGWRGRWEGGSGWGTHVKPWLIHVNVRQKPLQCCKVN